VELVLPPCTAARCLSPAPPRDDVSPLPLGHDRRHGSADRGTAVHCGADQLAVIEVGVVATTRRSSGLSTSW
jgi:hypothetical protein